MIFTLRGKVCYLNLNLVSAIQFPVEIIQNFRESNVPGNFRINNIASSSISSLKITSRRKPWLTQMKFRKLL